MFSSLLERMLIDQFDFLNFELRLVFVVEWLELAPAFIIESSKFAIKGGLTRI